MLIKVALNKRKASNQAVVLQRMGKRRRRRKDYDEGYYINSSSRATQQRQSERWEIVKISEFYRLSDG